MANRSASYWARQLYGCLRQMAAHNTNAVLLTLADVDVVEIDRRYPDEGLRFANQRWRAFYHRHRSAAQHEHGHFHIFTGISDEWAHVAGLAVDMLGQPTHWFTVNRWVTDGPWLERTELMRQLQIPVVNEQDSLPGRWLFALLQFYQAELSELFRLRDQKLGSYTPQLKPDDVLEDRGIYTLSTKKIELQVMLEKHLLQ